MFIRNTSLASLVNATFVLVLLLGFGVTQPGSAQTALPLSLSNNYMVTGDYVVGGWNKSMGTITIPDPGAYAPTTPPQQVPAGADIVAAFLYWQTVESSGTNAGENGSFNGKPITGTQLGNLNAPVSWSSGGCAGSAQGSKTIVTYRANVSSLIPLDANGNVQPYSYPVSLPDTGKAGQPPFTMGATLVIIYRVLAPDYPLKAVIIYDGAYAPSNTAQTMTQPMLGFYQADNHQGLSVAAKITHIVGNGQTNKNESVSLYSYDPNGKLLQTTQLTSLYGTNPPFPGNYNTTWDNPTWFVNYPTTLSGTLVAPGKSESASTVVVPSSSNKGCVSWGAVIMSLPVQESDHDGILDSWKTNQPQPGYCDAGANRGLSTQGSCPLNANDPSWVALPGAQSGQKDVFIQLDYMCGANADGTANCDPNNGGVSYEPNPQAVTNVVNAFSSHAIVVHINPNDSHAIPMPPLCADQAAQYCPFPPGTGAGIVGWKEGFSALKSQPLNYTKEADCKANTPPLVPIGPSNCVRRFPPSRNISYHEVIFAQGSSAPNWTFLNGSLISPAACGNTCSTLTFTTSAPHGLTPDPMDKGAPNGRVTIADAISNPNLNGTYLVQSVTTTAPYTFTINASVTSAPTQVTDPFLSVTSGVMGTASGISDIGGADSLVSLGLWGVDGQTVPVQSGTFMHELGHSLALTHGGLYSASAAGGGYSFSFEPNCKSNFQSVMNYLFQVDLLDGVLDYSEQGPEDGVNSLNETLASPLNVLGNLNHPTTKWYAPKQAGTPGSPATSHCDGTPKLPAESMVLQQGPAKTLAWTANQDINFDGKIEANLDGFNDWAHLDLRQVGATGNDFWVGGGVTARPGGGGVTARPGGGGVTARPGGGGVTARPGGGGVGEITVQVANSSVRVPTSVAATLTPSNTVQLNWTPPSLFQSLIASFNIYRSVNGPPFSLYANMPVAGTLPLLNQTFKDSKVACGATYTYFVTTVLTDGRESVSSNTSLPISVPCIFIGFLSPLTTAGTLTAPSFSGQRNSGNAVPIKWELTDANGNPISDLTTLKSLQACPTTGSTAAPPVNTPPTCVLIYSPLVGGEGSTTFRFSSPQFIVNWDTGSLSSLLSPGSYWTIELQLSDGSAVKATTIQF